MNKAVYRNWDLLIAFAAMVALGALYVGDLAAALLIDVPGFLLVTLLCWWLHAPLGLFSRCEYANGKATVKDVLRRTERSIDIAGAAHLYKYPRVIPYLVVSDEPLSGKKEALASLKAGRAGFVILAGPVRGALTACEKKAQKLR